MKLIIEAFPSYVGFHTLRALLSRIEYFAATDLDNIIFDLIRPFAGFRSSAKNISLTDNISEAEQLRFFLLERTERRLAHLAEDLFNRFGLAHCEIRNAHFMDEGSRRFFEILVQLGQCKITFSPSGKGNSDSIILDNQETDLVRILSGCEDDIIHSIPKLTKFARSYLRVGDIWSAKRIFDALQRFSYPADLVRLRAISGVMSGDTFSAEYYYRKLARQGTDHEFVSACYGLSMLYMRHHPENSHDINKARAFLNDAYEKLETMEESDHTSFQRIFNRNGYALTDFRLGELDLAANALEKGIHSLREIPGESSKMHSSVLIYNLAQCRSAQKKPLESLRLFEELVVADPNYPEYKIDFARSLIADQQTSKAREQLEAAIDLDSSMPEAHVLLGNCFNENNEYENSARSFEKAHHFDKTNLGILYSLCFAMKELGKYEEVQGLIKPWLLFGQSHENWEDLVALYLEITAALKGTLAALNTLNDVIQKVGTTENLDINKELLAAACR